jgi:hypothetical protein
VAASKYKKLDFDIFVVISCIQFKNLNLACFQAINSKKHFKLLGFTDK